MEELLQEALACGVRHLKSSTIEDPAERQAWVLPFVRRAVADYVLDNRSCVRLVRGRQREKLYHRLRRFGEALTSSKAISLSDEFGLPLSEIQLLATWVACPSVPLDEIERTVSTGGIEDALIVEEERAQIRSAVDSLPPREREVVAGRYLQEEPLPLREIAGRLGVSIPRVSQIQQQGLKRIAASV